ncbi:MAG: hypothetical protein KDC46_09260 [Thermoleophilia bacterium]|nr:hypothetical protein [Thermoleophilia bacterium]
MSLFRVFRKQLPTPSTRRDVRLFAKAFPSKLEGEVRRAAAAMPPARFEIYSGVSSYTLDGVVRTAPRRIYNPEPKPALVQQLGKTEQLVLHCLYTRHRVCPKVCGSSMT